MAQIFRGEHDDMMEARRNGITVWSRCEYDKPYDEWNTCAEDRHNEL